MGREQEVAASPAFEAAVRPAGEPHDFALIIGAMKSGTTSLFDALARHPQIAPSRVKEPDFFCNHADPQRDWRGYLELWDWNPECHRIALEASTAYSKWPWVPEVPERIAAMGEARFRFIYMLRNPITRIASQVRHSLFEGWGQPLDDGLSEDLIDYSRYAMQLDRYTAHFPRESILVLPLEEFSARPRETVERVCDFLGIDGELLGDGTVEHRNSGEFYNVAPAIARITQNRGVRAVAERVLPRRARHAVRKFLIRFRGKEETLGRWRLNAQEREQVFEQLGPDLARLKAHYGIDVERYWDVPSQYLNG